MSFIAKLIVSLVIATSAYSLTIYYLTEGGNFLTNLPLFATFCVATVVTALITGRTSGTYEAAANDTYNDHDHDHDNSHDGREQGEVKWFNVSKGFGFIVKDDGEEIFVHFRSIRGEGRRSLRDGERVSFVVAQSDKGPQAEDVEALG